MSEAKREAVYETKVSLTRLIDLGRNCEEVQNETENEVDFKKWTKLGGARHRDIVAVPLRTGGTAIFVYFY